jgi:uroporphyrinogen decarboxylase
MIEAGLDAINPVQFNCAGMQIERLKREFGKDLTFWGGGCDTQAVLLNGTPEEVRQQVREQIAVLASGGGFVFQQVHNILAGIPPENIIAMFETAQSAWTNKR